jgi:succinyl-diaminopimelate desuccinylase
MKDQIIELTSQLIKFKSTKNNPIELKRCIDFIEDYFSEEDVFIQRYEKNGKPSLVVTLQETKSPEIFMAGHLDVIEAEEEQFYPHVEDGKLYGRGAGDMKNSVAIIMLIMRHFARQKDKPSLGAMFTTDEEIGGFDGVQYLLKQEGYRSDVALIPDGGAPYDTVVVAGKGVLHLHFSATGKAAHGSRVWEGDNAADKLIDAYNKIRAEMPEVSAEDYWHETCNLGKFVGGESTNRVPDVAEMFLDFRFTEKYTVDSFYDKIRKLVPEEIKIEIDSAGNPVYVDPENEYLKKYIAVNEDVIGKKPIELKDTGATDGRFFADYDIPVIIQHPTVANLHGLGEYTEVDTLEPVYEIFKKFIEGVS